MNDEAKIIRRYADEDLEAVVGVWHRAGRKEYSYLPAWKSMSLELAMHLFPSTILSKNEIWVGVQPDGALAAFMAIKDEFIDRLYVDPDQQRRGWGTRLLDHAKTLSPQGLELYTHQENTPARAFYEKHGFKAVSFGISPPPESVPDVKYRWVGE